jgi:hypothetical protein
MLVAEAAPRIGETRVGLFDSTTAVVPVEAVTPVPPFPTGNVPETVDKLTGGMILERVAILSSC